MRKTRQQHIAKRANMNAPASVVIKGCLEIKIQSVIFHKDRFITFEKAAQAAEAMGLSLDKQEESQTGFIFHQCDSGKFQKMSLQTIELEHGVSAVIGVPAEDMAPELPHDANAVSQDKTPAGTISQPSPEKVEIEIEAPTGAKVEVEVEVTPEQEIDSWQKVEQVQSLGYVFMSTEQGTQLKDLKDEFGSQVKSVKTVLSAIVEPVTKHLDSVIDSLGDNDSKVELIDRVNTGLILLDEALVKFDHTVSVEIDQEVLKEITAETQESVCQALKTLIDVIDPVVSLFEDTSFENLHTLLKAVRQSSNRIVKEFLDVKKGLMPTKGMTREELKKAQELRSQEFGIEIVNASALDFPADFPTDLADYGDPVNLKFPIESRERATGARVRFKQFANEIFKSDKSKAIVHERIVKRELELGITVSIDPNDPLDELLSDMVKGSEDVVVIEKEEDTSNKVFVAVTKSTDEQRIAFGIVLEPDVTDLHKDTYTEEEVEKAAHFFMEEFQNIGVQHTQMVNNKVNILESYIAPTDLKIDTPSGVVKIKKNTWLMKVRVKDTELWNKVKSGDLTGFSIGALANVESLG